MVVDRLAWDRLGRFLLAATGARPQDRGHIALLDGQALTILDSVEVAHALCMRLFLTGDMDRAVVVDNDRVEVRDATDIWELDYILPCDEPVHGAGYRREDDVLLLTDGQWISVGTRETWRVPALPDCSDVTLMPDGRAIGVSEKGIIRCWQEPDLAPGSRITLMWR